ncbi:hypothetical protein DRN58_06470 [Thermococci archaeon]|nr:MAG: hypothetical protein DRN58_06470 [Thermococci archaeon]
MSGKKRKKKKTAFGYYNLLKFSILEILYNAKYKEKRSLTGKEIWMRLCKDSPSIYEKHSLKNIYMILRHYIKFNTKKRNFYISRRKNKDGVYVYKISKHGEELYLEMKEHGLKAPVMRRRRIMQQLYREMNMREQKAFFKERDDDT